MSASTDSSTPPSARRVLCLVPDENAAGTALAFDAALDTASTGGVVVLYDRSEESYRPDAEKGLRSIDERVVEADDPIPLRDARRRADERGVEVLVWQSTEPSIGTGLLDVIQHAGITDIVVPEDAPTASLPDRFIGDDRSLVSSIEAVLQRPLFAEAHPRPSLHLLTSSDEQEPPS